MHKTIIALKITAGQLSVTTHFRDLTSKNLTSVVKPPSIPAVNLYSAKFLILVVLGLSDVVIW